MLLISYVSICTCTFNNLYRANAYIFINSMTIYCTEHSMYTSIHTRPNKFRRMQITYSVQGQYDLICLIHSIQSICMHGHAAMNLNTVPCNSCKLSKSWCTIGYRATNV